MTRFERRQDSSWIEGAIAGLVGGLGMGLVLHVLLDVMPIIGTLVGRETVAAGWAIHLVNSTLFGLLFVAVFDRPFFDDLLEEVGGCLALGVVHGSALGLLTGGLFLPVSLALAGSTSLPIPVFPFPGVDVGVTFALTIAIAHLLYGVLLGLTYANLTDAVSEVWWWPGGTTND